MTELVDFNQFTQRVGQRVCYPRDNYLCQLFSMAGRGFDYALCATLLDGAVLWLL